MEGPAQSPNARPLVPVDLESRTNVSDDVWLDLAERLLSASGPLEVAAALLESFVTFGFRRGVVLSSRERRLSPIAAHGLHASTVAPGSPAVDQAHEQQQTQVIPLLDPEAEPWLSELFAPGCALLVLPLIAEKRTLGTLVLQTSILLSGRSSLAEVERVTRCGALALSRVQRLAQLQRLAATDDLTMIANRRGFLTSLDRELSRSIRRDEPVSLVLLDIDNFKGVNDMYGHPAGDEALRNVAAALAIACRDLDTPARHGGDEFAVIVPDCDPEYALVIAERLCAAVSDAPAVTPLTASAGVATFPTHAGNGDQLIEAADLALLQGKRSRRERTIVLPETPDPDRAARRRAAKIGPTTNS